MGCQSGRLNLNYFPGTFLLGQERNVNEVMGGWELNFEDHDKMSNTVDKMNGKMQNITVKIWAQILKSDVPVWEVEVYPLRRCL